MTLIKHTARGKDDSKGISPFAAMNFSEDNLAIINEELKVLVYATNTNTTNTTKEYKVVTYYQTTVPEHAYDFMMLLKRTT